MKGGTIINRKRLCYIIGIIILATILLIFLSRIPYGDKKEVINKLKKSALENETLICDVSKSILLGYADLSNADMKDWEKLIQAKDKVDTKDFEYLQKNADLEFSFMDTMNRGGIYFEYNYSKYDYNDKVRGGVAYIPYTGIEKVIYFIKNMDKKYYKISSDLYVYQYNATKHKNKSVIKKLYKQYKDEFTSFSKEANDVVLKYITEKNCVNKFDEVEPKVYEEVMTEFLNSDSIQYGKERKLIKDELGFEYIKGNNPYIKNLISFIYCGPGEDSYGISFNFEDRDLDEIAQQSYGSSLMAGYYFKQINMYVYTFYTDFYGY